MTIENKNITLSALTKAKAEIKEEFPQPPTNLIFDDGEPLESNRHRIAMNTLIHSIIQHFAQKNDYFVGGNMFIYYSSEQVRNKDFRGPDFFVVFDVDGTKDRQGWVVWEENGRYPDVIIELMSPTTASIDMGIKKDIYEQIFHTSDYFVFNPFKPDSLRGWHLNSNRTYQPIAPNSEGWLWSERLGLWLGIWEGKILNVTTNWLRFYDSQENLVLLPEEAAEAKANAAEAKANAAQTEAEAAQAKANAAEAKANAAQTEAEAAQARAENAQNQLEMAKQQALQQGTFRQLLRVLTLRFGQIPIEVEKRLEQLSVEQLENLIEIVLTTESLDNFLAQLG